MTERLLILDIETVPDLDAGRRLLGLASAADADVRAAMIEHCRRKGQSDDEVFIKPALQKLAALAFVEASRDEHRAPWKTHRIVSASAARYGEGRIIERLAAALETDPLPVIVGWNTSGFDLPVLRYRAMALSLPVRPLMFRYPEEAPKWRWPDHPRPRDYWKRYGDDHIDLMDLLSGYGASTRTSLIEIAAVLGLPGKMDGMDGSHVEAAFIAGRHDEICRYCEVDTVMLYCAWLRYQLTAEDLTAESHAGSLESLGEAIDELGEKGAHLAAFRAGA
jgi:predicted PolB exonuclease-like 3'-5' exonuclease